MLLVLGGVGVWVLFQAGLVERVYVYQDGSAQLRLAGSSTLRNVSWSMPREIAPGTENVGDVHWGSPALTVGAARGSRGDYQLNLREFSARGWTTPLELDPPLNSPQDDITPDLNADGDTIYFSSNRPGGLGGFDIYAARRGDNGWETPVNLGSRINSPYDETGPAIHPSGAVLVFTTNRPRSFILSPPAEWSDVPRGQWRAGDDELAFVRRPLRKDEVTRWSECELLDSVVSREADRDPCFSPSGEFLYFVSARPEGSGGLDIYRAHCLLDLAREGGDPWFRAEAPQNAGRPLNSVHDDEKPRLFLDGFGIVYSVRDPATGVEAALESRTREVEADVEIAAVPLRMFARNIVRLLALLVGAIVLSFVTISLLRRRHVWTRSLLVRCAAIAVIVHAGMLYGFYFWVVSQNIVALAEKAAPVRQVTVEKLIQAKILTEATLVSHPAAASEILPARTTAERLVAASQQGEKAPDAVTLPPEAADPNDAPVLYPARMSSEAPALPPAATAEVDPGLANTLLPAPEPAASPDAPAESPRAEPNAPIVVEAPPPEEAPVLELKPEARVRAAAPRVSTAATQVHSPEADAARLPPVARPTLDAPSRLTQLEVPAQAPEVSAEALVASSVAASRIADEASGESITLVEPSAAFVAAAPAESSPWTLQASGLVQLSGAPEGSRELPYAELPLRTEARLLPAKAAPRLPEARPIAAVSREAESALEATAPRAAERTRPAEGTNAAPSAPVISPVAQEASGPRIATLETLAPLTSASPAPLASLPAPGAMPFPGAPPADAAPADPRAVAQPESTAAPAAPPEGPEIREVIAPRLSTGRLVAQVAPRTVPRAAPLLEAKRVPADPTPKLGIDAPVVEARAVKLPRARPTTPRASADLPALPSAMEAASKLPEAPPGLERERDLRKIRGPSARGVLVAQMGGNESSEGAVRRALDWLARHQSKDGRWDVDGFDAACMSCRSPGFQINCDAAVTALALLCFLGQNHAPTQNESPFRRNSAAALAWLLKTQRADGCLAGDDTKYTMYSHGIATLALSEAYILTKDEKLREPLRKAVTLITKAQNTKTGGWRYMTTPPLQGDTSITGWQVLALTSARSAGIEIPEKVFDGARHWLDVEVASGQHGGVCGYTKPEEPRVAMTAEGMYARLLLGGRRTDRNIEEAARYIHTETRNGGYLDNLYLLYYGNLALYHYQGWIWDRWNLEVREFLVRSQQKRGALAGSWDPAGPWTETGGRVLATCFATLTLEVYYRYLPLYWTLQEKPAAAPQKTAQ
ncbi:MAG TPA: hypothetical protein VFD71_09870 [Planctomycetota bacterium]|nr:hypothetical protein [Planctomycetota bacterium]